MKPSGKDTTKIRLQTFLAHQGVSSRRKAMDLIKEGKVRVNNRVVTEPSTPVLPTKDKVLVDGKPIKIKSYEYLLLHKKEGFVTTKAYVQGQKNIYEFLPAKFHHLTPVGRLDKDTEGLLLLTNDGALAHHLTHPKHNVVKTYHVIVKGSLERKSIQRLERGIYLEGRKTAPAKVKNVRSVRGGTSFYLYIHEGRKRQVRLMCRNVGHPVEMLKRLAQGPLLLGRLPKGQYRLLRSNEVRSLKRALKIK